MTGQYNAEVRCGGWDWLEDPATTDYFVAVIKNSGLAGGDGALRLVKHCEDFPFEHWAINFRRALACS